MQNPSQFRELIQAMPESMPPFVSVIVPVWNSPDLVRKCLSALAAQTYPADSFEVLVVDNASTDSTADVVRAFSRVTLLSEPRAGSYHARNTGLAHARGTYVAFTDADCIPHPDWLTAGIAAAERHGDLGIVAGRVDLFHDGGERSDACEMYERTFAFNQEKNARFGNCFTANWISPRALLTSLGGFNGDLKSGGDFALSQQIKKLGKPIVYEPAMIVQHPVRATFVDLARKRRRVIGGRWRMQRRRFALLRWILICLRESAGKARDLVFHSNLPFLDKVKVGGVLVSLTFVTLLELFRIAFGGLPHRA